MRTIQDDLKWVSGGDIYQAHTDMFILMPGDTLTLPSFTIEYPNLGSSSTAYVLNGDTVHCSSTKEDNEWNAPSQISNSGFAKDSVMVQTDGNFLYVHAVYASVL
jgi:hypothetical protein